MCEICESMLAAEHAEQPEAELCPKCRRFPLDADVPLDLSQWDYVAPELRAANESGPPEFQYPGGPIPPVTSDFPDVVPAQASEDREPAILEEPAEGEAEEEHVRTCYHCYQIDSGLAEPCPVCGDSYLPPSMRKPHYA